MKCQFIKNGGFQCKANAKTGQEYCSMHHPMAEAIEEAYPPGFEAEEGEGEELEAIQAPDPSYEAMSHAHDELLSRYKREDAGGVRPVPRRPQHQQAQAAPPETEVTPEVLAEHLVQMLLQQEAERRFNPPRHPGARDRDGMLPRDGSAEPSVNQSFRVVPRRRANDETLPIDPVTGKPPASLKPGYVYRNVRVRDHHDRPTMSRVAELERYEFEIVRDANGDPMEGRLGILMQGPPESQASYTFDKTPQGSQRRDEALYLAGDVADDVNRAMNQRVANVVVGEDYDHQRVMVNYEGKETPV